MASISPIQLLPPETIDTILSNLVEDPNNIKHHEKTSMKNCALVSREFGAFCQSYLFRAISGIGFYERADEMLMRLVRTLAENPSLIQYIRHITVGFSELGTTRCRLTSSDITQASSILLQLPNLQSLKIMDIMMSYDHGNREKVANGIYALLQQMIHTNLSRGSLRCLHVVGCKNLPVTSLLTHGVARELRLGGIPLPLFAFSCPHITNLDIYSNDSFDISVLSRFPRLEQLSLSTACLIMTPSQHHGTPSLVLRELNLQISLPKMTRVLVDFYSGHVNSSTATESGEIVPVSHSLLKRIQLSTKILKVFPRLTNLYLALYITVYPQEYDSAISQAILLLDSISNQNAIEEFVFTLRVQFFGLDLPPCEPWSQIGRLLSNPAWFPVLRKVQLSLFLETDDETLAMLMESSADIDDQLEYLMMETKTVLLARGIEFESNGYLT